MSRGANNHMPILPQTVLVAAALAIGGTVQAESESLLTVERSGETDVLFHIKNSSTNSVRLPSAGYAISGYLIPLNTNHIECPIISCGLWLTADWRYVGTNWWWASREDWQRRLQIRTLKPGETLEVTRRWDWEASLLTNTNAIVTFCFDIPKDWADSFGLFPCSLCVTGFCERVMKTTMPPNKEAPNEHR